jgi:hypothetical protein
MSLSLTLLLAAAVPAGAAAPDLDFRDGRLTHWQGHGFSVGPAGGDGPSLAFGVCSSDRGPAGRKALLHRTLIVPPGTEYVVCRAAAYRPDGVAPGPTLDVVLEASGREFLPREVRTTRGWRQAVRLAPPFRRKLREYRWRVSAHAGRRVRIALIDEDDRPGCHLVCGRFRLVSADEGNAREFASHMLRLEREHRLRPVARYDSKHFLAISNAPEDYTERRLHDCEMMYGLFFEHFRRRGFAAREPAQKMMVALFDTQEGFESYFGVRLPSAVTGLYHPASNRLVVYDFGTNRAFVEGRRRMDEVVRRSATDLERGHLLSAFARRARDYRDDTNVGTIMHEVAHQLSFNGGLLNRTGDGPAWLVEGLACYCEPTIGGAWQGPGEANPARATVLARADEMGGRIPLRRLVEGDDWVRKSRRVDRVLLGYSQSWALFDLLMKERPRQLARYLQIIYPRRTPDHRLADFAEAFGADLARLERRYQAHVRHLVRQQARVRR